MTDDSIEAKALVLVNEVRREYPNATDYTTAYIALHNAIEQREILNAENQQLVHDLERQMTIANKHVNELEAFRREVSDAVKDACKFAKEDPDRLTEYMALRFAFLIIPKPKPKPDPLVDVLDNICIATVEYPATEYARRIRAALEARGLEIREKEQ
jgi:hypothetical protein